MKSKRFNESPTAHKYLDGLQGVEIGESAHNAFGLNTINVDYSDSMDTVYKKHEVELCGEAAKVDVVADARKLPFDDKSYDFVLNSHVLEHLFSPIDAILEWKRVARKYIFIIVPRMDLTFDKDKKPTKLAELLDRYLKIKLPPAEAPADDHHNIWNVDGFKLFCFYIAETYNMKIVEFQSKDEKVGNGMLVLFEIL